MIKLDLEQRERARELGDKLNMGDIDPDNIAYELVYLRDRVIKLETALREIGSGQFGGFRTIAQKALET